MRAIDADELIKELNRPTGLLADCEKCMFGTECIDCIIEDVIKKMPTIDLLKHGEWQHKEGCPLNYFECSLCGNEHVATFDHNDNFCSNCGADMRGKVNEPYS